MNTNEVNALNYFSPEMQLKYMGSSQYKMFCDCESMALAEIRGEYIRETTTSLLIGSYCDAHFEGTLDNFMNTHPEIFLKGGKSLKSEYKHAETIIRRLERDEMFMKYMSGEKQVIKTGEIDGVPFKIKIDCFHPGKAIVDLKIMRDFKEIWKDGLKLHFAYVWRYDFQAAIYQAVEGNKLPFFIAAGTKEKEPNLDIFSVPQERIDYCLSEIKKTIHRFADIKKGLIEPTRCGNCDWCKSTKTLTKINDELHRLEKTE